MTCDAQSYFQYDNKKASAQDAAKRPRGWPKTLLLISPSEERFAFLRRPQVTLEASSMMGEAYHDGSDITPEGCVNDIFQASPATFSIDMC